MIGAVVLTVASFVAMEGVSYAAHRWLMHGPGMGWHRSHHLPPQGRFERNDLFPVCFSAVGIGLFAAATLGPVPWLFWIATGITAYGVAYLVVHEVFIHRRLPAPSGAARTRVASYWRDAHRVHHATGGEPYGMLLPLRPGREERERVRRAASTRSARSRL